MSVAQASHDLPECEHMASLFTHAITAASMGLAAPARLRKKPGFWLAALLCSALPDIDVIGFSFGVRYGDLWGHRGMTHSLLFAAMVAVCMAACIDTRSADFRKTSRDRVGLGLLLFAITASHGALDAMTNGGLGVAFFSPFDRTRYFFPWRPIRVSPIGTGAFFSERGLLVLRSEVLWVWVPSSAVAALLWALQSRQGQAEADSGVAE
jgi:inner membrane protein